MAALCFGEMMQYVYLLESDGYFKIGIANDVASRMAQLSTGNPHAIGLVDCYEFRNADPVEKALHQKFDSLRWRGEWFKLSPTNITEFSEICELLGGERNTGNSSFNEQDIEDAEEMQEEVFDGQPKRGRPISGNWRIEFLKDGETIRARLRRGSFQSRKNNFISLGTIEDVYFGDNDEWKKRCMEYCVKTGYKIKDS